MEPTQDYNHVPEGVNLLIGQYRGLPNITGVLTAFLNRVQELENVFWDVIESQLLTTPPTGQALYQIADMIQCPRGDFTDAELVVFVLVWIRARKSGGRAEDILAVVDLVLSNFNYAEFPPAAFEVWIFAVLTQNGATAPQIASALAQALHLARPIGVSGVLVWQDPSWVGETFFFKDSASGAAGSGLQDSVSHAYPFGLLSAIAL